MSQDSLPPEADELVEIRREALPLLREISACGPGSRASATPRHSRLRQAACSP